jgi:formyl-CoA transferase
MIERVPHPTLGELVTPGVVIKMSDTPGAVRRLGPELGEHTDEVLESLLGLSADELARLRAAQVI